jgi:hypothetical protein
MTRTRWLFVAAWASVPLVGVLVAVSTYYWKLSYDIGRTTDEPGLIAITAAAPLVFATFGALIAAHRPRNPIGWIFIAAATCIALRGASYAYGTWGQAIPSGRLPGSVYVAWFSSWIWPPAIGMLATFLPMVFPDGKLPSRRWRPLAWLSASAILAISAGAAFKPGGLEDFPSVANPFASPPSTAGLFDALGLGFPLLAASAVMSVASLVLRARRSGPIEREQIKWIAYAAAFAAAGVAFAFTSENFGTLAALLIFGPLCGIPIASAIAIYRYRLFDIDRLISRTFSYAIVTAVLGGLFAIIILLPAVVVGAGANIPDYVIAAATVVVATLFRPVRRRVQGAVDRRFNRARYDAARTIEEFSARLREEVDINTLAAELQAVVTRTMQPAYVSLWIREKG